jgi:hypothetical protein
MRPARLSAHRPGGQLQSIAKDVSYRVLVNVSVTRMVVLFVRKRRGVVLQWTSMAGSSLAAVNASGTRLARWFALILPGVGRPPIATARSRRGRGSASATPLGWCCVRRSPTGARLWIRTARRFVPAPVFRVASQKSQGGRTSPPLYVEFLARVSPNSPVVRDIDRAPRVRSALGRTGCRFPALSSR